MVVDTIHPEPQKFANSQDFLDLDEPPKPKESPQASAWGSSANPAPNTSNRPFIRRHSTNYIDALNSKRHTRHGNDGSRSAQLHKQLSLPAMNLQLKKHLKQAHNSDSCEELDSSGEEFASATDNDDEDTECASVTPQMPHFLQRRRSSLQYEDFKKNIYDQLHMFTK